MENVIEGSRTHHPQICCFGILIILALEKQQAQGKAFSELPYRPKSNLLRNYIVIDLLPAF